jgi:hypothetical protein
MELDVEHYKFKEECFVGTMRLLRLGALEFESGKMKIFVIHRVKFGEASYDLKSRKENFEILLLDQRAKSGRTFM